MIPPTPDLLNIGASIEINWKFLKQTMNKPFLQYFFHVDNLKVRQVRVSECCHQITFDST